MTTQTGKVGFVGGMQSVVIDQFEWGYKAGVEYANKTQGKNVTVDVQYLESFGDAAKGKATATKMYSDGCDIVFHAAGGAGNGVIEAAKEAGKLVIGVDKGQTIEFGMTDDAVGIPEEHSLMADEVYNQAIDLEGEIKDGKITPPANEEDFNAFVATL